MFYHQSADDMFLFTSNSEKQKKMLNPLPDDKILNWSKLKQIADDILNCILDEK